MRTEQFTQFIDLNEKLFNTTWFHAASECYKTLLERQQAFAEANLKSLTSHMSNLTQIKNPQEFVQCQSEFLHNNIHRGVQQVQENLHTVAKHLDALIPCCSSVKTEEKEKKTRSK